MVDFCDDNGENSHDTENGEHMNKFQLHWSFYYGQ
jgi:hypothetical protein